MNAAAIDPAPAAVRALVVAFAAAALPLAGCSRGPQFAEVEGVVTLDGQPLSDVEIVFLPELTLMRYPADVRAGDHPAELAESLTDGPTYRLAAKAAAANGVFVHASLYERPAADDPDDTGPYVLVGRHGSLTADEMLVPLLAQVAR